MTATRDQIEKMLVTTRGDNFQAARAAREEVLDVFVELRSHADERDSLRELLVQTALENVRLVARAEVAEAQLAAHPATPPMQTLAEQAVRLEALQRFVNFTFEGANAEELSRANQDSLWLILGGELSLVDGAFRPEPGGSES